MRFFIKSYIRRTSGAAAAGKKGGRKASFVAAERAGLDALKGVQREIMRGEMALKG